MLYALLPDDMIMNMGDDDDDEGGHDHDNDNTPLLNMQRYSFST